MSNAMGVTAHLDLGHGSPNQNGAGAVATELFQQHSKMVLGVCRLLLRDPVEAEDAMQQAFLSAYRSILAGSEPRQPAAWLAVIARNECLDRIRTRMGEPLAEPGCDDDSEAPDALAAVIANADLRALGRSIGELPTQQREALVLREFCGQSYSEVGAALGVSESAIGSLLFRARQGLRATLQGVYGLLPLPALWDALAHLLARGPSVEVATLPVAKLATGAVAVGLLAGGAVAIERNVATQIGPPLRARVGATAATHLRAKPLVNQTRVSKPTARASSSRLVAPTIQARLPASPPAKPLQTVRPAVPAPASQASDESPLRVSPAPASQAGRPSSSAAERSSSVSARGRLGHGLTRNGKPENQQGHKKSSGKLPSPRNSGAGKGSGIPSNGTPSNGTPGNGGEGNDNPNVNGTGNGSAGGSSGSAPPGNGVGNPVGDTQKAVDHENSGGAPPAHPGHERS
jgi:RNA polymerase sigma-70 factor (ECF subfamily)